MYFIYIIYSTTSDKYYVGYSDNPIRRLLEHNTKPYTTYTSKHKPRELRAGPKCFFEDIFEYRKYNPDN